MFDLTSHWSSHWSFSYFLDGNTLESKRSDGDGAEAGKFQVSQNILIFEYHKQLSDWCYPEGAIGIAVCNATGLIYMYISRNIMLEWFHNILEC